MSARIVCAACGGPLVLATKGARISFEATVTDGVVTAERAFCSNCTPRPSPRVTGVTIRVVRTGKLLAGTERVSVTLAPTVHLDGAPSLELRDATVSTEGDSLYIDLPDPLVRIS